MNHYAAPAPTYVPPTHPGGFPQGFSNPVLGPAGPPTDGQQAIGHDHAEETLASRMARLNVNREGSIRGRRNIDHNQSANDRPPLDSTSLYEGWTFYKAEPETPDQKRTWRRANRMQMDLTQKELSKKVQKKSKRTPVSRQYSALSKLLRAHVDRLIDDRNREQNDHRVEWRCAYVEGDQKLIMAKNSRHASCETVSMVVIIKRKVRDGIAVSPINSPHRKPSYGEMVDLESHMKQRNRASREYDSHDAETDARPVNGGMQNNMQWPEPGVAQGGSPPGRASAVQQPHPTYPHAHPPPPPPAGPGQTMGGHPPMAAPIPPQVVPPPQIPPTNVQPIPGMHHGNMNAGLTSRNNIAFENLNPPAGPQRPEHHHPPFAQIPSDFPRHENTGQPRFPGPNPAPYPRSHKPPVDSEPEWTPKSSSVEDDESSLFDREEESSSIDDLESTDDEIFSFERSQRRGSLHHRQHSPKWGRDERVYRSHYRRPPSENAVDGEHSRTRHRTGQVELVSESSNTRARRQLGKQRVSEAILLQHMRNRPKIHHDAHRNVFRSSASSMESEPEYLEESVRAQREIEDRIRKRLLDDRERSLERREKDLAYQARKMERLEEEARYLDRHHMSLGGSPPFHPLHSYYPRASGVHYY